LARYADSNGADENHGYPVAWRYRDYVIQALNADLPYDDFVMEQLAGDLLPAASEAEQQVVASKKDSHMVKPTSMVFTREKTGSMFTTSTRRCYIC